MYKRNRHSALTVGIFCAILVFLAVGSAYAACTGNICVIEPGSGDQVRSGTIFTMQLTINWDRDIFPVSQYKLYYSCLGSDFLKNGKQVWRLITTRYCSPYGGCPLQYPWEVPFVQTVENYIRSCAVGVVAFDQGGNRLAASRGSAFKILPYNSPATSPYFMPFKVITEPGGSVDYTIFGGTHPYKVTTSNPAITTINGLVPPQTFAYAPPVTVTVWNSLVAPCQDTKVTIFLEDRFGAKTQAAYWIDCPQ